MTPEEGKENIDTVCDIARLSPKRIGMRVPNVYSEGRLDSVCDAAKGAVDNIRTDGKGKRNQVNPGLYEDVHNELFPSETPSFGGAEDVKSPLAIDLDGNGIATHNIKDGVYFDIDNDGFAEKTGWINNKDAFLVMDKNSNGTIDNATELFGDYAAINGFEALKELDSNNDGVINNKDKAWSELKLWKDTQNNGFSETDELISLEEAGIEEIDLNYKNQDVTDENCNEHRQTATVHWQDGHTTVIEDIWFQTNQAQSIDLTGLNVSDEEWAELAELPYIDAFGDVHSLWVAMSLNACNNEFFTKSYDFQAA